MPDSNLFTKYTDAITALKPTNLSSTSQFPESLFIDSNQQLSTWYSPFDYINTQAKIVIVGITPGTQQATNALIKAHDVLLSGGSAHQAKFEAKVFASFSGTMRGNLIEMLDYIGIHRVLNIASTNELFDDTSNLAHFTSVLRYPVLFNGKNYNGTPSFDANQQTLSASSSRLGVHRRHRASGNQAAKYRGQSRPGTTRHPVTGKTKNH